MKRRTFLETGVVAAVALPVSLSVNSSAAAKVSGQSFAFARIRYGSGNWDADPKMPANLLNSLVEYTSIKIDPMEKKLREGHLESMFRHILRSFDTMRAVQQYFGFHNRNDAGFLAERRISR